jgi:hypothetical protein
MRIGLPPAQRSTLYFRLIVGAAILLVLVYAYIYIFEPFPSPGSNLASNLLTVFSSLASAVAATMVWAFYDKADAPRHIWDRFSVSLWLWFVAEVIWAFLNMRYGEVNIGLADFFWVLAYGFMFGALIQQLKILSFENSETTRKRMAWMGVPFTLLTVLLVLILINFFYPLGFITTLVNGFYPLGDLLIGLLALWLVRSFQGGIFVRPWVSLILFAVTDFLYFVLEYSGAYSWGVENANPLSAMSDILYFAAYLAISVGIFGLWLSLRYSFLGIVSENKTLTQ